MLLNMPLLLLAAETPSPYYAFSNSDGVGKSIVIFLLVGSIFTWTIMLDKYLALRQARKESEQFLYLFANNNRSLVALMREASNNSGPIAAVYATGIEQLLEFYEQDADGAAAYAQAAAMRRNGSNFAPVKLSPEQLNAIEAVLEREVSQQIMQLETRVGTLATIVSVSPFFGLFGTVWGVMIAFCGIAAAGKSDFTALAPGVAGALLTTVAGLVVAIPSLIGYNLITASVRRMTVEMDNFTEAFMVKVKLEQLGSSGSRSHNQEQ